MSIFSNDHSVSTLINILIANGYVDYNSTNTSLLSDREVSGLNYLLDEATEYLESNPDNTSGQFNIFYKVVIDSMSSAAYQITPATSIFYKRFLELNDKILEHLPEDSDVLWTVNGNFSGAIADNWGAFNVRAHLKTIADKPEKVKRFFKYMVQKGVLSFEPFMMYRTIKDFDESTRLFISQMAIDTFAVQTKDLRFDAASACCLYDGLELLINLYSELSPENKKLNSMLGCNIVAYASTLEEYTTHPGYVFKNLTPGMNKIASELFGDNYKTLSSMALLMGTDRDSTYWRSAYIGQTSNVLSNVATPEFV